MAIRCGILPHSHLAWLTVICSAFPLQLAAMTLEFMKTIYIVMRMFADEG